MADIQQIESPECERLYQVSGESRGWIDQELPDLFRAVDAHLDSIAERINLGIEPGSLFVRIEKAKE